MAEKRRVLSLKEKIDVVEVFNREKLSVRDLAKRFNIGKTQAAAIIKKRSELLSKWNSNINTNVKRSFLKPIGLKIDQFCYDWFIKARNKGIPLSGPLIQAKAKEIAETLGYENFSASSGWLEKFRHRHNIVFKAISGEAGSVNLEDVNSFLNKLPSLLKDYSPKDIYNADETGLFFRALPDKTLTLKREKCVGGKLSKERLTIMHCVNMAGEKEKLLVIGKLKRPRAFKNISVNRLPVVWKSNKKAWMTCAIMEEWLKEFDRRMGAEKRKILLFLDNACSHPKDIRLANIQLAFLPPNCTSIVQPLDQGIIKNFKAFYRVILVKNLLSKMESVSNFQGLTKAINVLDAVYFTKSAWHKVTKETITNCFLKAGIETNQNRVVENDDFSAEDNLPLSILREIWKNSEFLGFDTNDLGEFINIDSNVLLEDDSDPIHTDYVAQTETTSISDDSDEDVAKCSFQTNVTNYQQAISMVKELQEFAKNRGDSTAMELLSDLELHFLDSKFKTQTRQTTLLDFFSTTS